MLTLHEKVKKLREFRGFKQDYMADKLGISQSAYSKLESGDLEISDERLEQISRILGISVRDILSFDEKKVFNVMHNETVQNANFDSVGEINYHEESKGLKNLFEDKIKLLEEKIQFLTDMNDQLKKENERLKSGK